MGSVSTLLVVEVSASLAVTRASLTRVPCAVAAISVTRVMVAEALGAKVPSTAVAWPPCPLTVPWVVVPERKVTPAGKVSVTLTPVAVDGPPLVTSSV